MRILRFLLIYIMLSVFGVMLSLFLAQNEHAEQLSYFGLDISTNLAWIILGAATCGFLVALLLILPGRIGVTWHNWTLGREAGQLEQQLALLHEEHERLLMQHERILEGHGRMLLRYERLLADHSRVVSERDQACAQLSASAATRVLPRPTLPPDPAATEPRPGIAPSPSPVPSA